jgi:hypothetical protein
MISKSEVIVSQKEKLEPYLKKAEKFIDERLLTYEPGGRVCVSRAQLFAGLSSDFYDIAVKWIIERYEVEGKWKVTLKQDQRDGDTLTFE